MRSACKVSVSSEAVARTDVKVLEVLRTECNVHCFIHMCKNSNRVVVNSSFPSIFLHGFQFYFLWLAYRLCILLFLYAKLLVFLFRPQFHLHWSFTYVSCAQKCTEISKPCSLFTVYKVLVCNQYIIEHTHSVILNLCHKSTTMCFSTEAPSFESHYNKIYKPTCQTVITVQPQSAHNFIIFAVF